MLRVRRRPAVVICVVWIAAAISSCGEEDQWAYGCQGENCVVSFTGADSVDLSSELGEGVTIRFDEADGDTAVFAIAGEDVKLTRGEEQMVEGFRVTLTDVEGPDVTLRIERG